jgi:hypothetical protein
MAISRPVISPETAVLSRCTTESFAQSAIAFVPVWQNESGLGQIAAEQK